MRGDQRPPSPATLTADSIVAGSEAVTERARRRERRGEMDFCVVPASSGFYCWLCRRCLRHGIRWRLSLKNTSFVFVDNPGVLDLCRDSRSPDDHHRDRKKKKKRKNKKEDRERSRSGSA